jgi:hypothetical protein
VLTEAMSISCGACALSNTPACEDCVVTFVLEQDAGGGIVIDVEEARAVRMLQRAGLVPALRFHQRAG